MVKTLFIPAIRKNLDVELSKKEISKLGKSVLLLYSIQYKELAKKVKGQLEGSGVKIKGFRQVLGCSKISNPKGIPVLLVSTGDFHARNLYLQTPQLYLLNNNKIIKVPKEEINKLEQKRKTALIKFLSADRIGILVSTKPGQNHLEKALRLKQKLIQKNKQPYIFISNNIDISQFENFDIQSWINTACPGLIVDNSSIINYDEIKNF